MELIPVGGRCFVIVRPTNAPDLFVPGRGIVVDVKMDPTLPVYRVKLHAIYERINFVRRHVVGNYWKCRQDKPLLMKPATKALGNMDDFNTWLSDQSMEFRVEYPFAFSEKAEMLAYFNKLNDYVALRALRLFRDITTKKEYTGQLRMLDSVDFEGRMWEAFADKFGSREEFAKWTKLFRGPRVGKSVASARMTGRRGGT